MCNLFPYKNHHYRSKYPIVLLQERCEILQFKSGHPVSFGILIKLHLDSDLATTLGGTLQIAENVTS